MQFDLTIPKKNYTVQMGIRDLGFIKWVNNARVTKVDTNIHFEGLILNDFNQIATSSARTRLSDSLKALPSSFTKDQSYIQLLPSYMYAKYTQKWGTDLVSASVEYIYLAYAIPKASFTYYRVKKQHSFNTQLVLGGYNQYDVNFGYSLVCKKFKLHVMLKSIRGYIAPKVFSGAGLYLNLSKSI
ncbi:MAG: hypothetical protein HYZ42_02685 [Bacteroidetes bacterium]|nr:hypothetical protein [Bacteroidota bacterium]